MCGIAGFSLVEGSTINARRLANALLTGCETRGRDAAGFAYAMPDGSDGMHKRDVPGSQLSLKALPKEASSVILHTRASTHGSPQDMRNNHPIESPGGDIRLVHNGVIWNHNIVRQILGKRGKSLPEVDSSVIGAIIEFNGLQDTDLLEGDAACAWFDKATGNTLHLAKFQHSPVATAQLLDGSFVFASTAAILAGALNKLDLLWVGSYPEPFYTLDEGEYWQVDGGEIVNESRVVWGEDYSAYTSYNWRSTTDGGESGLNVGANNTVVPKSTGSENSWDFPEVLKNPKLKPSVGTPQYYLEAHDGDFKEFTSLTAMIIALNWHSKLTSGAEITDDAEVKWINHFIDIGTVNPDGTYLSWRDDRAEMDLILSDEAFDSTHSDLGDYANSIKDGVSILNQLAIV